MSFGILLLLVGWAAFLSNALTIPGPFGAGSERPERLTTLTSGVPAWRA